MKKQESNSDGPDAVCGDIREATVASRVRPDYEEKTGQAEELGQDAVGNREPWGTAELDFTNNAVGTIIGYRDTEMDKDMNLAVMTLHLNPSSSICSDMDIKEQAL